MTRSIFILLVGILVGVGIGTVAGYRIKPLQECVADIKRHLAREAEFQQSVKSINDHVVMTDFLIEMCKSDPSKCNGGKYAKR